MTRIGLLSDTHHFLDKAVFKHFENCDEIWHAGDFGTVAIADDLKAFRPLRGVYGNIDGNDIRSEYPGQLAFYCEQVKVFIKHIGGYPGRYAPGIKDQIKQAHAQLFISGHSHILKVMRDEKHNNMIAMNPGAAGVQGFHKVKTVLRFTLNNRKIENLEVVELGKRGEIIS